MVIGKFFVPDTMQHHYLSHVNQERALAYLPNLNTKIAMPFGDLRPLALSEACVMHANSEGSGMTAGLCSQPYTFAFH